MTLFENLWEFLNWKSGLKWKLSNCREKLDISAHLNWDGTDFTMLGLKFSTDLNKMLELNYDTTLHNIEKEIKTGKVDI